MMITNQQESTAGSWIISVSEHNHKNIEYTSAGRKGHNNMDHSW